jgi:hypothetical protein
MNCKPGDLAIIIHAIHPENVGAIVEVIAPGPPRADIVLPYWHTRTASGRTMKFTYRPSGEVGYGADAFIYDRDLRPLRPDLLPLDERTQVPINDAIVIW